MPENPLLPNAELRALYLLLQEAEVLTASSRQHTGRAPKQRGTKVQSALGTEALLAATLLQLQAGDVAVPEPDNEAVAALLQSKRPKSRSKERARVLRMPEDTPRLVMAAGLAAGLRRLNEGRLVVTFCRSATSEPRWSDALTWAQQESLPLITVCIDTSGAEALRDTTESPEMPSWTAVQQLAMQVQVPVLAVDGQDAVAMYRVMQESILRARALGGPVVLWAVLPAEKDVRRPSKGALSPLQRLEDYLRVRSLPVPARKALTSPDSTSAR